jgi:hypothetical protein
MPCGGSARRDLKRDLVLRHRPAVRRDAVGQEMSGWRKSFVRSARTRWSVRNSRGRARTGAVQTARCGIVEKCHLTENRADTIKHATSPSHRDRSRQVVIPRVFQIQSPATERQNRPVATPPRLARPLQHAHLLRLRRDRGWLVRISLIQSERDKNVSP